MIKKSNIFNNILRWKVPTHADMQKLNSIFILFHLIND